MSWTITWPAAANIDDVDPAIKALAELYAGACLTMLTLQRVGGDAVTIMPAGYDRVPGYYIGYEVLPDAYPLGWFYPGLVYPSAQDLKHAFTVTQIEAIRLPGPVGVIEEVRVGGVVLDAVNYRLENGNLLVRIDGGAWPAEQGDDFTVSYFNSHPVDEMGANAGGIMAFEWLKLITGSKTSCRLPPSVTNVTRQGLTFSIARGMFPDGLTGIPEIDAYIMLFNPWGLKVAPRVYSPDLPVHRQVR